MPTPPNSAAVRRDARRPIPIALRAPEPSAAHSQTTRQDVRQPSLPDATLRLLDVVLDPRQPQRPRLTVVDGVGGPRVAVARLADGAGVDDEAAPLVQRQLD